MQIKFLGRKREGWIAPFFRGLFDLTGWQWTRRFGWHPLIAPEKIKAGSLVYVDGDYVYEAEPENSPAVVGIAITDGYSPLVVTNGFVQVTALMRQMELTTDDTE